MKHQRVTLGAATLTLALAGCVLSIPVGSRKLDGPPRVRDLVDPLLKFKVLSREQLVGQRFEVTAEDSSGNPVPWAYVVMESKTHTDSVMTDSLGVTHITFTEELLEQNPQLVTRKDGKEHHISVQFFGSLDTESDVKPAEIDPYALDTLCADGVVVLWGEVFADVAGAALQQLSAQRDHIESRLALNPVPWGLVLIDTTGSIVLTATHYTRKGIRHHLCPLTRDEIPAGVYTSCFRTFVKNCLLDAVQVSEVDAFWFYNGLADYWTDLYLDSLALTGTLPAEVPEERTRMDNEGQQLLGALTAPVDLASWMPDKQEDWGVGFELFRAYWHRVAGEQGHDVIPRVVAALAGKQHLGTDDLLAALRDHAGEQSVQSLHHFEP